MKSEPIYAFKDLTPARSRPIPNRPLIGMTMKLSDLLRAVGVLLLSLMLSGCAITQKAFKAAPNQLHVENAGTPVPFSWHGGNLGDRVEPNLAMLIPVRFTDVPRTLYMQFDLGAQSTVLYRAKLESIRDKFGGFVLTREGETDYLGATTLSVGDMRVIAHRIRVMTLTSAKPINWETTDAVEVVGTIGADLIDGRTAVVDYPKRTLTLYDELPASLAGATTWGKMRFVERRIFLEAIIAGKARDIVFDTGSSAFALLTEQSTWKEIAKPGAPVERFDVKSWNDTLKANLTSTDANVQIGNATLPIKQVTYLDGVGWTTRIAMHVMGVDGMSGNKLFLDHTIVLDTKANRFGLLATAR
jgi:hypothetical protein